MLIALSLSSVQQAAAEVYTWIGNSSDKIDNSDNWEDGFPGWGSTWNTSLAYNFLHFANNNATYKAATAAFTNMYLAGVIVDKDAEGYSLEANASGRNLIFQAAQQSDVDADSRLTLGESTLLINANFSIGSGDYAFSSIKLTSTTNIIVASGSTLTSIASTLNTQGKDVKISGGGTVLFNLSSSISTNSNWTVSGGSTLQLEGAAANILTAATTGSITLDNGTLALASGSTLTQSITLTDDGGSLSAIDGDKLTLNGSIYASSLDNLKLDLSGLDITLGEDFAIYVDSLGAETSINLFEDATISNVGNITVFVDGVEIDSSFTLTNGSLTLTVVPEPTTSTLTLLALSALMLRRKRKS